MNEQTVYRATGFRTRAEGGEGGGASWENEVEVILSADEIRFIETQVVDPQRVTTNSYRIDDLGAARLGPDSLALRVKRKRWWHHLVRWLDDPSKIRFRPEQAQAVRALTSELIKRIR